MMSELLKRIIQGVVGNVLFELPMLKKLRAIVYQRIFDIGKELKIGTGTIFYRENKLAGKLHIGDKVVIGSQVLIDYSGNCTIGNNVWISHRSAIFTHEHQIIRQKRSLDKATAKPLIVNDNVWIGYQAIVLPSVNYIGKSSIVGAGSVVTKDIPANCIVGGNPARIIRKLST